MRWSLFSENGDLIFTHSLGPETGTVGLGVGVPSDELGFGDAVLGSDDVAGLPVLDEVELVAIAHHAGLDGKRRGDSIARGSGRRRGWLCRCWDACGGRRGGCDGLKVGLDTVRVADEQIATVFCDGGVL